MLMDSIRIDEAYFEAINFSQNPKPEELPLEYTSRSP
jgi:hypothetical protein